MDNKKREKFILDCRKKRITLQEIGDKLNLTRERVRQIEILATGRKTTKLGKPLKQTQQNLKGGGRERVREIIRLRDKQTCQKCGKKWRKGMRRFDVHHLDEKVNTIGQGVIKYDKENMDKLITFCHKCHYAWHKEKGHTKEWHKRRSVYN